MDIVAVNNNQFTHYPKRIAKGTVDAEQVKIQLDKEWDGLTVRIHWLNVTSKVEKKPLLERDKPNTIPWEVLADLGELHMGLVGLDGNTVIKPTIWLTYGYVADGVDPEAGSDPQPPTPSWEQQMVEQATQAKQAAQAAQEAAEDAAESAASAGPYAEEAKKSAEAAKASQEAAATSAQQASQAAKDAQAAAGSIGDAVQRAEQAATAAGSAQRAAETAQTAAAQAAGTAQGAATTAGQAAQTAQGAATQAGQYLTTVEADAQAAANAATAAGRSQEAAQGAAQAAASARDQANTAATTAQDHATAAGTAKEAAEQAATTAGNAQAGAAQSAQAAASSAAAAQEAQQAAEAAAAVLPKPTQADAGKGLRVNDDGTGYEFGSSGGGELLLAEYIHQGNKEIHFTSFDWETGTGECTEPHGLTGATAVMLVPTGWTEVGFSYLFKYAPIEWELYAGTIYLSPVDELRCSVVGTDKVTPITVDILGEYNTHVDISKIHFEVASSWSISKLPINPIAIRILISGYIKPFQYRYLYLVDTNNISYLQGPTNLPKFGALSNPYHAVYSVWNGTFELTDYGSGASDILIYNFGRRANWFGGIGETGFETLRGPLFSAMPFTNRRIKGLSNPGGYGFLSNNSIIRIYAKAVKQE